jgi:hypothetical protein
VVPGYKQEADDAGSTRGWPCSILFRFFPPFSTTSLFCLLFKLIPGSCEVSVPNSNCRSISTEHMKIWRHGHLVSICPQSHQGVDVRFSSATEGPAVWTIYSFLHSCSLRHFRVGNTSISTANQPFVPLNSSPDPPLTRYLCGNRAGKNSPDSTGVHLPSIQSRR